MDLSKFSREDWILAGVALLLAIDLLFLPWFDVSVSFAGFHASATSTATGAPDGWLGVLAVLALVALIADLALERLGNVAVPMIGGNRATTRLVLAAVAAAFVVLKFLFHIHFSYFGIGFWAAVVLTAALVVVAVRARDAERLMPTLA
jgi:hypothetical protein